MFFPDHSSHYLPSILKIGDQRVVLNGQQVNREVIESGIPKDSLLGPLLFLKYNQ